MVELNPFLLKNGKYKIKLQISPIFRSNDTVILPDNIDKIKIGFVSYISNKDTGKVSDYLTNINLPLKKVSEPTAYFEQEWEVEIKDLPYELEGWSNGQDLSKINREELEPRVVNYYQNLRELLNSGSTSTYSDLWKTADTELVVYDYLSEEGFEEVTQANIIEVQKCKDRMIPLEEYEMKLYGYGKIVSLERKANTRSFNNEDLLDLKGWSPLIRKYKISGGASYGVKLFLPKDSDEFVIIRN
ncbi:hypothetical protein ACYSNM_12890 [Myroides sp. LJL116]